MILKPISYDIADNKGFFFLSAFPSTRYAKFHPPIARLVQIDTRHDDFLPGSGTENDWLTEVYRAKSTHVA